MSQDAAPVRWETALPGGRRASLLARPNAINLLLDGEQPSFTFDPLGRLHGAFYEGRNYRRSLDNRVLAKWTTTDGGQKQRQRRWLAPVEAQTLVQVASSLARQTAEAADDAPPAVRAALASLARWDWASLEADRTRFQQIYTPIGILPPDQYLALVLQATHGCSHNACTFCTFYQERNYRRSLDNRVLAKWTTTDGGQKQRQRRWPAAGGPACSCAPTPSTCCWMASSLPSPSTR
jgi:hypothetical protein